MEFYNLKRLTTSFLCVIMYVQNPRRDIIMKKEFKNKEATMAVMVKEILEAHPSARDNDYILYGFVLNKHNYSVKKITFEELTKLTQANQLPTIESVGRSRRKVQELYKELAPSKAAKEAKNRREDDFKDLSKMKKGEI